MKIIIAGFFVATLFACANHQTETTIDDAAHQSNCVGDVNLPEALINKFEPVHDDVLLRDTLGQPNEGKLCQGKVYKSKEESKVTFFRAWNSTNPNSKLGKWWAFEKPSGKVSKYRSDYEICYQWSPLDKLVSCTLKPGVKVVVGTGQSAECSAYLSYPASPAKQIYIEDASTALMACSEFDGEFHWTE